MEILILEDPGQHHTSIIDGFKHKLIESGRRADIAKNVLEAYRNLMQKSYEFVLIHHHGFEDLTFLRNKFPCVKFIGYSGACFTGYNVESIMNGFDDCLKKEYDYVVYSPSCIDKLAEKSRSD